MAITVVQFEVISNGGNLPSPVTAGNSLLVAAACYTTSGSNITTSSPTLNGATPAGTALIESAISPAGTNRVYSGAWLLPNVSAGNGIGVTCSDNVLDLFVAEVSGLGATPALDQAAPGSGSTSTVAAGPTGAIAQAPELVFALGLAFAVAFNGPLGSPWTSKIGGSGFDQASYQVAGSPGGAYTWSSSLTGAAPWAASLVTVYAGGGGTTHNAAAALSGSGSLTAGAFKAVPAAAALSGSGSLTSAAAKVVPAAASMSGSGSLTAAAVVTRVAAAALSGSGSLTAGMAKEVDAAAALSGSGTLTAAAAKTVPAAASMSGSGSLTAGAAKVVPAAASLSGTGTLTAGAVVTHLQAAAPLSGSGTLTAGASRHSAGRVILAYLGAARFPWKLGRARNS